MFLKSIYSLAFIPTIFGLAVDLTNGNVTARAFLDDPSLATTTIEERTVGGSCYPTKQNYYKLVGDGNPHQNYKIVEIGGSMVGCPGSITKSYSHTVEWSIGGTAQVGYGKFDFANLSFKVTDSQTTSTSQAFSCDDTWAEACILAYHAVTAVSVEFFTHTVGCNTDNTVSHGTGVVYLPNDTGASSGGSVMRRGVNSHSAQYTQCRGGSQDREVDFFCGPKGGPEYWDNHSLGPQDDNYLKAREPANCGIPIEVYDWQQGH